MGVSLSEGKFVLDPAEEGRLLSLGQPAVVDVKEAHTTASVYCRGTREESPSRNDRSRGEKRELGTSDGFPSRRRKKHLGKG
eukprot:1858835-Pyramimonas_sp.AAC.1